MLKSKKNFIIISIIILLVIFIFGVQEFVNDKNRINCGTYSSYIGKGSEMIENNNSKIEALSCFNDAFNSCNSAKMTSMGSDWEGGIHENYYEINFKNNDCIIEHEYNIEAFYVPNNKLVMSRSCNGLSIENYDLKLLNCSDLEE